MSDLSEAHITCPTCKKEFRFSFYTSVNVTLDPCLRETVLNGDVHRHACRECGQGIVMQTPLLYHDATRHFMVFFEKERAGEPISWNTQFLRETAKALPQYQFRFVTFWDDLLEKISIFERGWDDKIIEMLKLLVLEKSYPFATPEFTNCTVLLAGLQADADGRILQFNILRGGQNVGTGQAPFDVYEGLARNQEARSGKNVGAGEWKMVNKATILTSLPAKS